MLKRSIVILVSIFVLLSFVSARAYAQGVTINTESGVDVDESGSTTDTYTIVLNTMPTAQVDISLNADSQVLVSNGGPFATSVMVSFDGGTWNTPQTVTVQGVDDATAEANPQTGTITHAASSADQDYDGIPIANATVSITDNDTAGVTINTGSGISVSETGPTTDTYTLVLEIPPTVNVTVTATADADTEVATDNANFFASVDITFTNGDWNTPQTVYVRAVDDAIAESNPHVSTITHTVTSSDMIYDGIVVANVLANVTDNDLAGFAINTGDGILLSEATPLTSDSLTTFIDSAPSQTMTLNVSANAQTMLSKDNANFFSSINLTFDSSNYSTPQTIYVRAVDDFIVESNPHLGLITFASSGPPEYEFVDGAFFNASITDNDVADVIVSPTTADVTEGGANDTYTIVLGSQPANNVTISFNTGSQVEAIAQVIFTTANWNVEKIITAVAVDDAEAEGNHSGTIQHTVTSGDSDYDGFAASDVTVNITDNEIAEVIVSPTTTGATEGGPDGSYSIVLSSQPADDVTLSFSTGTQLQAIPDVTFTSADWDVPQNITVVAVDDALIEGNHTGTIQHSAASADSNYDGIAVDDVTVNITDNDALANLKTQSIAVDPLGRFVIYTAPTAGCSFRVLNFQQLDSGGNVAGAPRQLVPCGTVPEDVLGIDIVKEKNSGFYWISFGGSLPTDPKFLLKIDEFGNIVQPATGVVLASAFGSDSGATAIAEKGCCRLFLWISGADGSVYRTIIPKATLIAGKVKKTTMQANRNSLHATQRSTLPTFLALERFDATFKAIALNAKGLPDGNSWRLSPATDGGHETGAISADGLFALSNSGDSPVDRLYAQPLKSNGLPEGSPGVVANGAIASVDVTNLLAANTRYVIYVTDVGALFLQIVDGTTGGKIGKAILLN